MPSGNGASPRPIWPAAACCSAALWATLASYCLCIALIKQRQAILDNKPADRATFSDMMKAIAQANRLAVELGLTVTSRTRAFQGKSANERDWDELVG
jgi:hypothetical protein